MVPAAKPRHAKRFDASSRRSAGGPSSRRYRNVAADVDDGSHLDRRDGAGAHEAARDRDRVIEILRLDDGVSPELLARFGERTVGEQTPSVAVANRRRRAGGMQGRSGEKLFRREEL